MLPERFNHDIVIIGGGQAGLAMGYLLKNAGKDFIILERNSRTGDSWRNRWESLELFTPSQYDSLPGMAFPAARGIFPGKDQLAGYLEKYSEQFNLPVSNGINVSGLSQVDSHFEVQSSAGLFTAGRVIVATGTNPMPKIPAFAGSIRKEILQIHSSSYQNPDTLPKGEILVVGAGTSGVEIAIEVSKKHKTYLSGRTTFHIPDPVFRYAGGFYWWFISNVMTINTPMGRKARAGIINGGAPLIRVSPDDVDKAGVERLTRVSGVSNGLPLFDDGRVLECAAIIWATGYRPDFSWISMDITDSTGWPRTKRGISDKKGLYFIGMPFQYSLTSGLVGGVGRDAEYILNHL